MSTQDRITSFQVVNCKVVNCKVVDCKVEVVDCKVKVVDFKVKVLDFNVSQAIEQLEKYKLLIDKYGSKNVFNINNSDDVLDGSEEVLKNDDINKLLRKDKIFKY